MAKISRPQESYDAELAEKGQRRILWADINDDGLMTYREQIVNISELKADRIPWWKENTRKKKPSKSSKA